MKPDPLDVRHNLQAQLDALADLRGYHPFKLNEQLDALHAQPLSAPLRPAGVDAAIRRPLQPPRPAEAPLTPQEVARRLALPSRPGLSPTAYRIYLLVVEAGIAVAQARGYSPRTTHVTFFCPAEIVAFALGVHRCTLWRHCRQLKERGLIDSREHKGSLRGQTVADGTLWQVRLNPGRGRAARLRYEDLCHPWRDLDADVEAGRTAHRFLNEDLQQSKDRLKASGALNEVLAWALPPRERSTPLNMTVAEETGIALETVLDVPAAPRGERAKIVDQAARAITSALGDGHSRNFYRLLLWNLLRRYDRGQDEFGRVYEMLQRVRADHQEGFARSAGALFVARLKAWAVWDELQRTPRYRVGVTPLAC
jgi:hypothetical protein